MDTEIEAAFKAGRQKSLRRIQLQVAADEWNIETPKGATKDVLLLLIDNSAKVPDFIPEDAPDGSLESMTQQQLAEHALIKHGAELDASRSRNRLIDTIRDFERAGIYRQDVSRETHNPEDGVAKPVVNHPETNDATVKWAGPHAKWRVTNSDGTQRDGFESKEDALAAA